MARRPRIPDLVALILVLMGSYELVIAPTLSLPTTVKIEGQEFSSPSVGLTLMFLATVILILNGNFSSLTKLTAERVKSLFLTLSILLILGIQVGTLLVVRTELVAILLTFSTVTVLLLFGAFVVPKLLSLDSALDQIRAISRSRQS